MLPKNTLGRAMGKSCKVYTGAEASAHGSAAPRDQDGRVSHGRRSFRITAPAVARAPSRASASFPAPGKVTVNGREGVAVFRPRGSSIDHAKAPFKVTDTVGHFDVKATINGGGIWARPARCATASPAPCSEAGDYRAELTKAGYLTRDSRMVERKKVRPEEGSQAPAVQQALVRDPTRPCERTRPRGGFFFRRPTQGRALGADSQSRLCAARTRA